MPTSLRRDLNSSALPILPHPCHRGTSFGASRSLICYNGAVRCAPSCTIRPRSRPPRLSSRLPTDRSPSPLRGITTTATGLLLLRDLHPLDGCCLAAPHPACASRRPGVRVVSSRCVLRRSRRALRNARHDPTILMRSIRGRRRHRIGVTRACSVRPSMDFTFNDLRRTR